MPSGVKYFAPTHRNGRPNPSSKVTENSGSAKRRTGEQENPSTPAPVEPIAERFPALEEQEVELTFYAPEARSVEIAGNFNDWRPVASPMTHIGTGEWSIQLKLKSGRYEYRFVVDGVWSDDPKATETVANPHGGKNSVLVVRLDDRTDLL